MSISSHQRFRVKMKCSKTSFWTQECNNASEIFWDEWRDWDDNIELNARLNSFIDASIVWSSVISFWEAASNFIIEIISSFSFDSKFRSWYWSAC